MVINSGPTDGSEDNVWIQLQNNNWYSCSTAKIEDFSSGDTLLWSDRKLGQCNKGLKFDSQIAKIDFWIKTDATSDSFCPKSVEVVLMDKQNTTYFSNSNFDCDYINDNKKIWIRHTAHIKVKG